MIRIYFCHRIPHLYNLLYYVKKYLSTISRHHQEISRERTFQVCVRHARDPANLLQSMADVFSKSKRSKVMAAIRSKGNKDTELRLAFILRAYGIKGWRRHYPLPGKPDFVFPKQRLAVFVDGCFWHSCPKHGRTCL